MLARLEKQRYRPLAERERLVLIAAAIVSLVGVVAAVWPEHWGVPTVLSDPGLRLLARIGGVLLTVGALVGALAFVRRQLALTRASRSRMLDAARDGVFVINDRGFVTLCNPAAEAIFGQPAAALMRDPYPRVFGAMRSGGTSLRELMMVGRANVDDLFKFIRPDGATAYLHLTLGRLRDERGVTSGLVGTVQDVTDQVRERSKLAESEAEHRGLVWDVLNDTRVGLTILNAEGRVVWVCQAMEHYFGLRRDDIHSRPFGQVIEEHIRPRTKNSGHVLDAILQSYEEGRFLRDAALVLAATDQKPERYIEYWSQPIRQGTYQGGRIEHFLDITHHVRARRELEQAHHRLDVLSRFTQDLLPLRTPEAIATAALDRLRVLTSSTVARVFVFDPAQGTAQVLATSRLKPRWQTLLDIVPLRRESLPRELWRGELFIRQQLEDRRELGPLAALLRQETDVQAWVVAPLVYDGELAALLDLGSPHPFSFHPDILSVVQESAALLATALHNAHRLTELQQKHDRLRALSGRLVDWQEAERRTLATELHDRIGQTLSGLNFTLAAVEQQCRQTDAPVQAARQTVARLVQEVQDLSQDLRPPLLDDFGLIPALRWLVERMQTQRGLHVVLRQANVAGHRFVAEIETAAYRVVQEALSQLSEAEPTPEVMVRLWTMPQKLYLDVEDAAARPGPTTTPPAGTHGWVTGLRERVALVGGTLTVGQAPAGGQRLEVAFPLSPTTDDPTDHADSR